MFRPQQRKIIRLAVLAGAALATAALWPALAPAQTAAVFEGARLITGGGGVIENSAFVVENGRFTAVGRRGEVQVPDGALRVILTA